MVLCCEKLGLKAAVNSTFQSWFLSTNQNNALGSLKVIRCAFVQVAHGVENKFISASVSSGAAHSSVLCFTSALTFLLEAQGSTLLSTLSLTRATRFCFKTCWHALTSHSWSYQCLLNRSVILASSSLWRKSPNTT